MKKSRFGFLPIGTSISMAFTTAGAALLAGTGLDFRVTQRAIL